MSKDSRAYSKGFFSVDVLEEEFRLHQIDHDFPDEIMECDRTAKQWYLIGQLKDNNGVLKYRNLAQVMKGVLVIPHRNADCERVFSLVRKHSTDFRPNLGDKTLESILIVEANYRGHCCNQDMSNEDLNQMKRATFRALKGRLY